MRLRGTWNVGRIAGITIGIHPSWLVVYALFAWSATIAAPYLAPQLKQTSSIALGLSFSLVLFASVVAHEFAHALVARRLGIPIAGITLFLFGGVALISREPKSPRDELRMAIAGPAASVGLAIFFYLLSLGADALNWVWGETLCVFLAFANALLAIFNMLPAFPSDGGRVLRSLLWMAQRSQARATGWASRVSLVVAAGLVLAGVYFVVSGVHELRGIWWVLIGVFLAQAAITTGRQARTDFALEQMHARDCMVRTLVPVPASTSVASFIGEIAGKPQVAYPVLDQGVLVGFADLKNTAGIPLAAWDKTSVASIMTPLAKTTPLTGAESARDVLAKLHDDDVDELPVYEGSELVGVITQDSIYRALHAARAT